MPLELDSLRRAVSAFRGVLALSDDGDFMGRLDEVAQNAIKSGAIQHFEFTYELCWKSIKRWLKMNVGPTVAEGAARRELFRLASEHRLIADVEQWMRHHDARNRMSHTYDPDVAEEVYAAAHSFAGDAEGLLEALEARND